MSQGERRLAAIMFTDISGFTALTQRDEHLSLELLETHRRLLRPVFAKHRGREIKTIGDAFLVEFPSALEATNCAVEMQTVLYEHNLKAPEKVLVKIGIHVGDVVEQGQDILGDAVNIASRIEPLAKGGEICISQQVYDQVRNKVPSRLTKLDTYHLKNVAFDVDVYRLELPWQTTAAAPAARPGTSSTPSLDKTRVAVLPLTNMSSDPEEGYFADGMTEELITSLSGVRQLTVIARTSVMSYRGTAKRAREIGRELEVGTLLEGSVRKAGNRVRITTQLINAASEGHLWAQNYDRTLEDVFAIQSDIAEKVAGELKVLLVDSEKKTLGKKPTENTEAYSDFLRARELLREDTETSVRRAIGLFEKAIELDPSFARAHLGLAECHQAAENTGYEPTDVSHPIVKASLKRALELEPDLPEAHASLSLLFLNEDDFVGAEAEARKALELNPSLPEPYRILYELAAYKGKLDEAVWFMEAGYRLDPIRTSYIGLVGRAYYYAGREHEALEHWKKTEQLAPGWVYAYLADYYLSKGDIEKAKEFYAKRGTLMTSFDPWQTWMGGVIAAQSGDRENALLAIKKIEDAKMGPLGLNYIGFVYHALGDLDSYFEYMDRALQSHALIATTVMYGPLLARARADPRYQVLVEKMKIQGGLTK